MVIARASEEVEVIEREEVFYACGCSTVRIERRRQPKPQGGQCGGHGKEVTKVVRSIEYIDSLEKPGLNA